MRNWLFILSILLLQSLSSVAQLSSEKYIDLARNDLENQNYTLAIQRLNFAIKGSPYSVEAFFLRAMAKYNLEDFNGAILDYTSCLRFAPDNPGVYQNRGLCYAQKGDHYAAIDDFKRALRYDPGNYFIYINKAYSEINLKQYDDVIATTKLAIQINPYLETAYLLRGSAYMEQKNTELAITDFTKVLSIDSLSSEAYLRRAMAYNDQLDYDLAIADCDSAIDLDSTSSLGYFVKANIYADRLNYPEALKNYDEVIALSPNNAMAHYNRANVYTRLDRVKDAAYDYKRVTEINPDNILGYFNLALAYSKMERYSDALVAYDKVLEMYPDMEDVYFNRAFVKRELGDEKGAAIDFFKGNEIRSKNKMRQVGFEDRNNLAKHTKMDADFYRPNFREEESKFAIYSYPYFLIKQFNYQNLSKKHLKYNIASLTEFNELYNNLPFFYVSNPLLGEKRIPPNEADSLLKLMTYDAKSPQDLLNKATLYEASFQLNEALAAYDTLISQYPDFALAYFNKASLMYALLEMYLSFNSFNGSIAEFGNSQPKNLPQLSDIEFKNLNITTIESLLKQCTARDPSFTYGWYNLALIYSEKSLYNYAIEAYGRAIKTNPNFAEAFYNRGLTYLNTDNTRKACNDLSKAGELGLPEAYEVIKQYCK